MPRGVRHGRVYRPLAEQPSLCSARSQENPVELSPSVVGQCGKPSATPHPGRHILLRSRRRRVSKGHAKATISSITRHTNMQIVSPTEQQLTALRHHRGSLLRLRHLTRCAQRRATADLDPMPTDPAAKSWQSAEIRDVCVKLSSWTGAAPP